MDSVYLLGIMAGLFFMMCASDRLGSDQADIVTKALAALVFLISFLVILLFSIKLYDAIKMLMQLYPQSDTLMKLLRGR